MKALMIAALMALSLQATAQDQNRQDNRRREGQDRRQSHQLTHEQKAEKQSARMSRMLHLSGKQQEAVYAANLNANRRMGPVKDQLDDAKSKARRIRQERESALKNTLTVEQYQKLLEARSRQHTARLQGQNKANHRGHDRHNRHHDFQDSRRSRRS